MAWQDYFNSNVLSGLLGAGATAALANYGVNAAEQAGTTASNQLTGLAAQLQNQLQFKPYTVTTGTGTTTATPTGLTLETSPQMQALQQQLLTGAGSLFGAAMAPVQDRATALTQMLEAASAPARQRDYLALENRLFQQGRGGVQTAQYGGTPEMLAFAKAAQEQQAQNALLGRQQAVAEQMQAYNVGQGMFGQSFLPQTQMLAAMQGAAAPMELAARLQTQQGVTGAELTQAAAQAQLQASQQANVLRQVYLQQALQGLFSPTYSVNNGNVTSNPSIIGGLLSDIYKGITS